jgi:predicted metal-dependent hydrolase
MQYPARVMQHTIGAPPIEITLRRTARARRFSLRVGSGDGRVTLSLPLRAREAEAIDFARAHEGWIRAALQKRPAAPVLAFGAQIMVEGEALLITPTSGKAVRVDGAGALLVPDDPARLPTRIAAFLKLRARDRLVAASDFYAAQLGRSVTQISLRDTRSRWGSCSAAGALMYNWRLIMAPPAVLSYVAAHEVAHLAQMNHSPAFWAVVGQLYPNWQAQRAWLKAHGGALQAVRFDAPMGAD